jgi:hypothetical protein
LLLGSLSIGVAGMILGGVIQELVPRTVRAWLLATLAAGVLVREIWPAMLPIPENRRLIPEHVASHGRVLGPLQFGFEMGTGVRTYSPSALPHLLLAAVVLMIPPAGAFAAVAGFASARWLMAVISNRYDDAGGWTDAWQRHRRTLAGLTAIGAVTALAAGVLVPTL